jgi:uncharacterized protein
LTHYVDTSVIVPLFITEPMSNIAANWFENSHEDIVVSALAMGEFYAVLAKYVRKGGMSEAETLEIAAQFDVWRKNATIPAEHESVDFETAAHLVRVPFPKLLMPDALHLATCKRLGLVLVTFDTDLLTIAAREGVDAFAPAPPTPRA